MSPLTEPTRLTLKKESVAATDTNIRDVSLLLHGNGANGSTTITDSSLNPKTVTAVGNAQISTAQSKFGGASIAFDGSGDYLSSPISSAFDLTANFTVELFARFGALTSNRVLIDTFSSGASNSFQLYWRSLGTSIAFYGNNQVLLQDSNASRIQVNTWHHIAVSRNSSNLKLFIDGTEVGSTTDSTSFTNTTHFVIGRQFATGTNDFNGYIDELRITKGVARYTSNFTPPTAPFPDF